MTQLTIVTTPTNSGDGTPLATAFNYCNSNFSELYARVQTSPPPTLVGSLGDVGGMYAYDSNYFYYCFDNYDGSSTIWAQVTQVGNVTVTQINNGTSNVIVDLNGNIRMAIAGAANSVQFTTQGQALTGTLSATGNILGSYILGDGSQLTGLNPLYDNSNVATFLAAFGPNTISTTGSITSGDISTGNVVVGGQISATGNIVTDQYFVGTVFGNITGNFVVPGGNRQVIFNTDGNVDAVAGFTYNKNSNTLSILGVVSATGNITGGNLLINGNAQITGNLSVSGTETIFNVANLTVNDKDIIVANNLTGGANVNGAGIQAGNPGVATWFFNNATTSWQSNIGITPTTNGTLDLGGASNYWGTAFVTTASATGNVQAGNLLTGGLISATGNITGNFILGNGSQLTGLPATYGNANVAAFMAAFGSNTITTTGNITGGLISATGNITGNFILGNGSQLTGIDATSIQSGNSNVRVVSSGGNVAMGIGGTANVVVVATTGQFVTGVNSVSGNITGGNILTDGLISATSTITSAANVTGGNIITAGLISATGNVTGGNIITAGLISATGNVTGGNLIVAGNIVDTGALGINTTANANITLNAGTGFIIASSGILNGQANGAGNIGNSTGTFNTIFARATSAQYADLAEKYTADADYTPGTVVMFGGTAEVTVCDTDMSPAVVGIVSTNPAYIMNAGLVGDHVTAVALLGRVPCQVQGPVSRGALMVSAGNGRARTTTNPAPGTIIGKAVESFDGDIGTIEILVGRV
jgi:hypothetical protein